MSRQKSRLLRTLTLLALVGLLAAGCARQAAPAAPSTAAEGEFRIVTSFYPIYLFTKNIALNVPGVTVTSMTEAQTGCLHDYQLSPDNLKLLESADAFVINGAGMEAFLDKVLAQDKDLKIIEAAEGIPLVKDPSGEDNPHVWVGISGAIAEVENISRGLSEIDPAHKAAYEANAAAYITKLKALQVKMHEELDGYAGRSIITFHEAFPYFAQEFDLNIAAVVEREPGSEPTAKELEETMEIVRSQGVKALFAEPQYPAKAAETIAQETGLKVYYLDPVASGSGDAPADSYEKTMETNMQVLKEALQ